MYLITLYYSFVVYILNKFTDLFVEYPKIFRTGDYAKIVKGLVIYEGRVDSQIKIRGHRVDLTEVEKIIARIPGIDKVVVLCYKPGELSQVNARAYSVRSIFEISNISKLKFSSYFVYKINLQQNSFPFAYYFAYYEKFLN